MTSTDCRDEWISEIVHREWLLGVADGALLGVFFVLAVVACVVAYALEEVEAGRE